MKTFIEILDEVSQEEGFTNFKEVQSKFPSGVTVDDINEISAKRYATQCIKQALAEVSWKVETIQSHYGIKSHIDRDFIYNYEFTLP